MTINISPYAKFKKSDWLGVTNDLIEAHPLNETEIVGFCLAAWENLFSSLHGRPLLPSFQSMILRVGKDCSHTSGFLVRLSPLSLMEYAE